MHASLDLFLVLNFFFSTKISLLCLKLVVLVGTTLSQGVCGAAGKPGANVALDFEGNLLALLVPHGRRSILARDDDLIISLIDI